MKIHNEKADELTLGWTMDKPAPPEWTACMVVKGTYALRPGQGKWMEGPPAPVEPAGAQPPEDSPGAGPVTPNDLAPLKMKGEVLLKGTAHPPEGQPGPAFPVRMQIGSVNKTLNVFGYRTWSDSLFRSSISEPEDLDALPIQWRYAFGGPDYAANPCGMGFGGGALPQLENASETIAQPKGKYRPAGFGPIADAWEPRASLRGTYRKKWLKTRWPWRPEDFDWAFYNEAPADQQINGFFRGDESFTLENLHPDAPLIKGQLPGVAARLFVLMDDPHGHNGQVREVKLQLDTVFIDADEEQLFLNWRGALPAQSLKLREVSRILIDTEPLSAPQPAEYYARRIRELADEERAATAFPQQEHEAEIAAMNAQIKQMHEDDMAECHAMGKAAQEEMAQEQAANEQAVEDHLAQLPEDAQAKARESMATMPPEHPATDRAMLAEGLDKLGANDRYPEFDANLSEAATLEQSTEKEGDATIAEMEQRQMALEKAVGLSLYAKFAEAGLTPPLQEGEDPPYIPGETLTREQVADLARRGVDFGLLTLEKLDLSGINFDGLSFNMVTFTECDLSAATFRNAQFAASTLTACVCEKTDFSNTQWERSAIEKIDLSRAHLNQWGAINLNFSECQFARNPIRAWKAQLTSFANMELPGFQCEDAGFEMVNFDQCALDEARFSRCRLWSVSFQGASLQQAAFQDCVLDNIRSDEKTSYQQANFQGCTGDGPIFSQADCADALFQRVVFQRPAFSEAKLTGANFSFAELPEAAFDGAELTEATLVYANLIRSAFVSAILVRTDFAGANLYEAGFMDATVHDCDFSQANVRKTLIANYLKGDYPVSLNVADHA